MLRTDFILSVLTKQQHKRTQKFLEVMGIFSTFIMVTVSWVFAKAQTHQDAYIKCVQFLVYQIISQ